MTAPARLARSRSISFAIAALIFAALAVPATPALADRGDVIELNVSGRRISKRAERRLGRAIAGAIRERGYNVSGRAPVEVNVRIRRRGRRWEARLEVERKGRTIGRARIRARSRRALAKKIEKRLWRAIGSDIERAFAKGSSSDGSNEGELPSEPDEGESAVESPPKAEPEIEPETEPESAAASSSDAEIDAKPSVAASANPPSEDADIDVVVTAGLQMFSRNLTYTDDVFQALREYKLGAAPAFVVGAEIYPVAALSSGALTNLGLAAMLARSPELSARTPEGTEIGSNATAYAIGLRYRHQLGGIRLVAAGDFGVREFTINDGAARMSSGIPDIEYRYLRLGGVATLPLSTHINLGAQAGYRFVLSAGEIGDERHFPRLSAGGVDAAAYLGYAVTQVVNLELGARIERYFYSMNPEPGDAMVAGGAVDQYLAAFLRLRYTP